MRWNDRERLGVVRPSQTHEAHRRRRDRSHAAQQDRSAGATRRAPAHRAEPQSPVRAPRAAPLRPLRPARCRASGTTARPYYRCKFPAEYAARRQRRAPPKPSTSARTPILPRLDEWLAQLFDPSSIDETCDALAAAPSPSRRRRASSPPTRRRSRDCDRKLARYRAALDAGTDPAIVAGWIKRGRAPSATPRRAPIAAAQPTPTAASNRDEIRADARRASADMLSVLDDADPKLTRPRSTRSSACRRHVPPERPRTVDVEPPRVLTIVSEGGLEPPRPCGH